MNTKNVFYSWNNETLSRESLLATTVWPALVLLRARAVGRQDFVQEFLGHVSTRRDIRIPARPTKDTSPRDICANLNMRISKNERKNERKKEKRQAKKRTQKMKIAQISATAFKSATRDWARTVRSWCGGRTKAGHVTTTSEISGGRRCCSSERAIYAWCAASIRETTALCDDHHICFTNQAETRRTIPLVGPWLLRVVFHVNWIPKLKEDELRNN